MKIRIILLLMFLNTSLIANELKIKKHVKNKSVYINLLSRFGCVLGPNVNNPKWICNKHAPKGWGEFYGKKLEQERQLKKKSALKSI